MIEKAISREQFRLRLRGAHGTALRGAVGIVETLVEYTDYPDQMDKAAITAATLLEEAASVLRRAVALVTDDQSS